MVFLPLLVRSSTPAGGWKTIKGTSWWLNISLQYGFLNISATSDLILNVQFKCLTGKERYEAANQDKQSRVNSDFRAIQLSSSV